MTLKFTTPPPSHPGLILTFPSPQILLIILNRPRSLNAVSTSTSWTLHSILEWYDSEPTLRCAILTGRGRAFCAGADLKEWDGQNAQAKEGAAGGAMRTMPSSGFGGVSRRTGKKPVIIAVNGLAFGGGMEMVTNADIVIASGSKAKFGLPEVKRGVVAIAGALPRLVRTVGRSRAMEMALTGRVVSVQEAKEWGVVSEVVDDGDESGKGEDDGEMDEKKVVDVIMGRKLTKRTVEIAGDIAGNSPDAVIVSKKGVDLGWEGVGAEEGSRLLMEGWGRKLNSGENLREGVRAFVEKRRPRWRDSKL